ncbi:MAG: hypothetical protein ACXWF9_09320 [Solirubrobacterales bacterium]
MSRGSARRVAACVAALAVSVSAGAAEAGAATEAAAKKPRFAAATQTAILKRGVTLRLRGRGKVKVSVSSSTFDEPEAGRLTRKRVVKLGRDGRARVRLKLTAEGRREVASCEARRLIARGGGRKARTALVRTTAACAPKPVDLSRAGECDFIGQQAGSRCLLPFPDDYNTVADPSSPTGGRVSLRTAAMPRDSGGTPFDAAPYNASDGFSQGATILVRVPGLDNPAALERTDPVPINHLGRYSEPDQPVVVVDAQTGQRHPIWVEIDSNASTPALTALEVHPAVNFEPGRRYIVAMRDLRDAGGGVIPAPEGFRYYRDVLPSKEAAINSRRAHFESLFERLRDAGIRRSDLHLAWDFTVASDESNSRRMLHIRDHAFGLLGDDDLDDLTVAGDAPAFNVTQVDPFTAVENEDVARRVRGTFTVPCYLQPSCAPGGTFALGPDGLPQRNGDYQANFDCIIPRSAVDAPDPQPGRPAPYGHGLFGSASEVFGSEFQRELANQYGFVFCATDEIGMSSADLPTTAGILAGLSGFPRLADRLQQGLLNELFLGRLMLHSDGLLSDGAFHVDGTTASPGVIDTTELYYVGASQGGIMGGALTAVAPDFTRAALNVPAMNYSVLLPRSVDYDAFADVLEGVYTDELSHPLILSLIQMLWDRGEPNGYAHRMTGDPLPDTPAHMVLMQVALGDHQVTNFQADVEARTIGAATHTPVLDPGRWPDVDVLWNVPAITAYPYDGSAILYGDIGPVRPNPSPPPATIGVPPPPLENVPNRAGEDPHGAPRGAPLAMLAIAGFLAPDGALTNVCGPVPCYAGGYTGP